MSIVKNKITSNVWRKIKTQYEKGVNVADIAIENGVDKHLIYQQAKRKEWVKGRINKKVDKLTTDIAVINSEIQELKVEYGAEEVDRLIARNLAINNDLSELLTTSIGLHKKITAQIKDKHATGECTDFEAAKVMQTQGLTVNDLLRSIPTITTSVYPLT